MTPDTINTTESIEEQNKNCDFGCNGCENCTDYDDEQTPCTRCLGDGRDPWSDYLMPCPICEGEQRP